MGTAPARPVCPFARRPPPHVRRDSADQAKPALGSLARRADCTAAGGHGRRLVPVLVAGQPVHRVLRARQAQEDRRGRWAAPDVDRCASRRRKRRDLEPRRRDPVFAEARFRSVSRLCIGWHVVSRDHARRREQRARASVSRLPARRPSLSLCLPRNCDQSNDCGRSLRGRARFDGTEADPQSGANATYSRGSLLFLRGATLMAQRFDVGRLELTGDPVPLAERVEIGGAHRRVWRVCRVREAAFLPIKPAAETSARN